MAEMGTKTADTILFVANLYSFDPKLARMAEIGNKTTDNKLCIANLYKFDPNLYIYSQVCV